MPVCRAGSRRAGSGCGTELTRASAVLLAGPCLPNLRGAGLLPSFTWVSQRFVIALRWLQSDPNWPLTPLVPRPYGFNQQSRLAVALSAPNTY